MLFSDGTSLTADDVVFSLERASKVPNSPSSFAMDAKSIGRSEGIDPLTVRIETSGPAPLLPNDLSALSIVSQHAASGRTTADFDGTTAAIGTGAPTATSAGIGAAGCCWPATTVTGAGGRIGTM